MLRVVRASVLLPVIMCAAAAAAAGCDGDPKLQLGVTPEEHTAAYFPISGDAATHQIGSPAQDGAAISCDSCHKGAGTFATPQCIICHADDDRPLSTVHAVVAGFIQQDTSCFSCHPTGVKGDQIGVDLHSQQFFPINPTDVHGGTVYAARVDRGVDSCTACHADVDDRTQNLCAECHARDPVDIETAHSGSPAIQRTFLPTGAPALEDSPSCKECHADTPIDSVMHPLSNHLTRFDPDHHVGDCPQCSATCFQCHDTYRDEPQDWAIEWGVAHCTGCHTHGPDCTVGNQGPCLTPPP